MEQANLLLVGGRAAAKSSFINAALTALEDGDQLRQRAVVGGADVDVALLSPVSSSPSSSSLSSQPSTTQSLERFHVAARVALWDSWGWSVGAPLDRATLAAMLDGDLASGWPRTRPISAALLAAEQRGGQLATRMHGVLLFVPAAEVLDADGYMLHAKRVVDLARDKGLQTIVILSLCDKIDAQLADRPAAVYTSEAVQIARSTAASLLQVPLNTVYPVKTYFSEYRRSADIDTLVLTALAAALGTAGEALRRRYDQQFGAYSPSTGAAASHVAVDVRGDGTAAAAAAEPLAFVSSRLLPLTQRMAHGWSTLFARTSYGLPPRSTAAAWRRVSANWTWLLAQYLAVVLAVWLGFALAHISTQPLLAALVGGVVLLWLVLFHLLPTPLVVRGWRFGKAQKEALLLVAMVGTFGAVLFGMGVWRPIAFISVAVLPLLCLHSLFYARVEHILPQEQGSVKGV